MDNMGRNRNGYYENRNVHIEIGRVVIDRSGNRYERIEIARGIWV